MPSMLKLAKPIGMRFEKEEETIQIVNLDTLTNLTKKVK